MSVRAGERKQGDLTVIVKAKEMVIYTLRITNNEKNFPKRYRLSVVNKMQEKAVEIIACLIEAKEYEKEFKDTRIIRLIKMIHASTGGNIGVPLGNQLSQLDALVAANPIDHMIKERLKIGGFARYNDDFYLIHDSKEYLKYCLTEIQKMADELGLKLNPKKTKIVPVTTGINYLEFRVYLTESGKVIYRIKAKSKSHQRQKIRKMKGKVDQGKI